MDMRQPADVFAKSAHEICIFGKTILIEGGSPSYCDAFVEEDFELKRLHVSPPCDDPEALSAKLSSMGVGICCRKGKKDGVANQDNVLFCRTERFIIAGVADGHGTD